MFQYIYMEFNQSRTIHDLYLQRTNEIYKDVGPPDETYYFKL